MKLRLAIAAVATISMSLLHLAPAEPCASVSGSRSPVPVAAEEAIVAYDSRTGTERFIRKATFDARDRDFGFLVPTPSTPTLSVSDDELFDRLGKIAYTPVIERRTRYVWGRMKSEETTGAPSVSAAKLSSPPVVVQARKRVGDFDATILKATNTSALIGWLKKHGYVSNPELEEWLQPYIRQGYLITAFRVAREVRERRTMVGDQFPPGPNGERMFDAYPPDSGRMRLSPVCMTFKTPTPFYPYRETGNAVARKGRLLRVYYLGDKRVAGQLGKPTTDGSREWGAKTVYSSNLSAEQKRNLSDAGDDSLTYGQIGDRLTVFEDRATLRARNDLFFTPAADQAVRVPKEVVYDDIDVSFIIPIALSIFAGTAVALWVRRRKRWTP